MTKRDVQMDQEVRAWAHEQLRAVRGTPVVPIVIPRRPVRHARVILRPKRPVPVSVTPLKATEDTSWAVEAFNQTRVRVVHDVSMSSDVVSVVNEENKVEVEPCVAKDVDESGVASVVIADGMQVSTRRAPVVLLAHFSPMCLVTDAITSAWFHAPARVEPAHRRAWTQVYRPHNLSEVIGNSYAKGLLVEWYKQLDKPCLLAGPVGVGKTCAAHALLESAGYDVVDSHDPAIVEHTLMRKLVPNERPIGLIIDEIDTVETHARTQLIKLVKAKLAQAQKTKLKLLPIVFICENASDKSLVALRNVCKVVRMTRDTQSVKVLLDKLARLEGVPRALCPAIEQVCNGDLRRATLLLELTSKRRVGESAVVSRGNHGTLFQNDLFFSTPFDAASVLLGSSSQAELGDLIDAVKTEGDIVPMLLHENYIQCEKSHELDHVMHAADLLADWDVMESHPSYQLGAAACSTLVCGVRTYARELSVVPCKSVSFTSYFPHLSTRRAAHDVLQTLNESFKTFHLDASDWCVLRDAARSKEGGKWLLEELPESCHAEFKKFVRSNRD